MSEARERSREAWQDMIRLRVRGTLESIGKEEGLSEPVARVRFVQFVIQGATKSNLRLFRHNAQSLQEAGEEALGRFLDGRWQKPRGGGAPYFTRSQQDWIMALWEVGAAEWDREKQKPKQLALAPQNPFTTASEQLRYAFITESWPLVNDTIKRLEEEGN